jgi:hypothetical protein
MNHTYAQYENTKIWQIIQESLSSLVENHDVQITTKEELVIGYIVKNLDLNKEALNELMTGSQLSHGNEPYEPNQ